MTCPCGGKIKRVKKQFVYHKVDCGIIEVEVCSRCKSEYFSDSVVKYVEDILKRVKPRRYKMYYLDK